MSTARLVAAIMGLCILPSGAEAVESAIPAPPGTNIYNRYMDYYDTNPNLRRVLKTVEAYHLPQGMEKSRAKPESLHYALFEFDFILRHFPNHPRALQLMSDLCIRMNKVPAAETYFDTAMRAFPQAATTYLAYGMFQYNQKKLAQSIQAFGKAVDLDPNSANAAYNLGLVYYEDRQYELANEYAQRAYKLGYTLPGLREKLKAVHAWKPIEPGAERHESAAAPEPGEAKPELAPQ